MTGIFFQVGKPVDPSVGIINEGVNAQSLFSSASSAVYIGVNSMSEAEYFGFSEGAIKCGVLYKNGALLLLWSFFGPDGQRVISFDNPLDVRGVSDPYLPDVLDNSIHFLVNIIAVDTSSMIVKALRAITFPNELMVLFLAAVQDQLCSASNGIGQIDEWYEFRTDELMAMTTMYTLGE